METKKDFIDYVQQKAKTRLSQKRLAVEIWVSIVAIMLVAALLKHFNYLPVSLSLGDVFLSTMICFTFILFVMSGRGKSFTRISKAKIEDEIERLYLEERNKLKKRTEEALIEIEELSEEVRQNEQLLAEL